MRLLKEKKQDMKKILLYLLLGSVVTTSCRKFIDVNTNPNTPTVTKANLVFSNALNTSARIMVGGMHITMGSWTGYYGHSTSYTGGGQEKTYVFTNNDFNYFDGPYDNLADYQYVIDHAVADGYPYLVGPSMIMQCMMMQKIVDLYGNVPYTQALQGTKFITPVYDDAATIYQSLVAKLTAAVALNNANAFPSNDPSDIFFNANKTRWNQLANTIKLRLIIGRSYVAGYNPTSDINSISGDGFIDATVTCQPGYLKTSGKLNWYYGNFGFNENDAQTGDFRKIGQDIVEYMKGTADVFRLGRIASIIANPDNNMPISTTFSDYKGVPLGGAGSPYLSSNVSAMGRMQIVKGDATRPLFVMSDAESYFLQAEARQRGWLGGSAQAAYEEGIRRDFRLVGNVGMASATATQGQADAAANSYMTNLTAQCDWTVSPDKLKAIWVQKWVALCNIDGSEAWAEYRRTTSPANPNGNLPTVPQVYSAHSVATSSPEPVRLFYPLREYNVNSGNVPTGIDVFSSRIFWDIN